MTTTTPQFDERSARAALADAIRDRVAAAQAVANAQARHQRLENLVRDHDRALEASAKVSDTYRAELAEWSKRGTGAPPAPPVAPPAPDSSAREATRTASAEAFSELLALQQVAAQAGVVEAHARAALAEVLVHRWLAESEAAARAQSRVEHDIAALLRWADRTASTRAGGALRETLRRLTAERQAAINAGFNIGTVWREADARVEAALASLWNEPAAEAAAAEAQTAQPAQPARARTRARA